MRVVPDLWRIGLEKGALDVQCPASGQHVIQCRNCGLTQVQPHVGPRDLVTCSRCCTQLEHSAGKSLDASLACAIAILVLLIPAFTAPFLTASTLGATRTSFLYMSVSVVWSDGSPLLAAAVALLDRKSVV